MKIYMVSLLHRATINYYQGCTNYSIRILFGTNGGSNSVVVFSQIVTAYRIQIVAQRLRPTMYVSITVADVTVSVSTAVRVSQ